MNWFKRIAQGVCRICPGGTHDAGRARNCTDYAGEPDRISTVPSLGRIISLTVPGISCLATITGPYGTKSDRLQGCSLGPFHGQELVTR
jgi:hypothetical protein